LKRVGIDLGGTNIAAGVVAENNKIIGTASIPTNLPKSAEAIADSICEAAMLAISNARISKDEIASIGIGTPGAVNSNGVVEFSSNLGFDNTPLKKLIEDRFLKPAFIENDANCAALGEKVAGSGKNTKDFIAVTLGTGVGGGIILDGKLLTGINGAAGEIGHMVIKPDGIPCPCGRNGCFEQYASTKALVRQAKDALTTDRAHISKMWEFIEDDPKNINGEIVFQAAHDGDEIALKVIDNFVEWLSLGIVNLINIFQPEGICIGGGIAAQGDFIIKPLIERVEAKRYTKKSAKQTRIYAATLGNDAGIIGAALLGE